MRLLLETYNAGDKGLPGHADIIALQERAPRAALQKHLPGHRIYYPKGCKLGFAWDPHNFKNVKFAIHPVHGGVAKVTPARPVLEARGLLDERKTAFLVPHLINNAFGENERGERELRLNYWKQGWQVTQDRKRELEKLGYEVVILGDLNRKKEHWPNAPYGTGDGYDRIFTPDSMYLIRSWHGEYHGSDHHPLLALVQY